MRNKCPQFWVNKPMITRFKTLRYSVLTLAWLLGAATLWAQTTDPLLPKQEKEKKPLAAPSPDNIDEEDVLIYRDSLASDKKEKPKVKKLPKRVYYGLKTRKGYVKTDRNGKITLELFYTLKVPQTPDPYVKDIYWLDPKKKKLNIGQIPEKQKAIARILHGPYKKLINGDLIEEGIFYVGTKHGRWEQYTPNDDEILVDKKKYYKGWPREAQITYYDADRKLIKEVIPFENGKRQGDYYYFHANGAVATQGKYENDQAIGLWKEFFDNKKKLKKETQYAENGFVKDFTPYVVTEFDEKGQLIYDKVSEDAKKKK